MREEYDLKKLKVKRRGLLPELQDEKGKHRQGAGFDFSTHYQAR